jgi:hypothetical protein
MGGPVIVRLPIKTVSVSNVREHWAKRAKRAKEHRKTAFLLTAKLSPKRIPKCIALVRIAPRKLDDDNLRHALKAVRDGVADRLQINDNDPRVRWIYHQVKGDPKQYAVDVASWDD